MSSLSRIGHHLRKVMLPLCFLEPKPLTILSAIQTCGPYRRLSRGHASARDTILVQSCSHAITAFFSNLRRGNIFLSYMASIVVLSEALTVTLSGVPFNTAQPYTAHLVSTYLSIVIISVVLAVLIMVLLRQDDLVSPYPLRTMLFCVLPLQLKHAAGS